jgi:hypothetical protein
METKEFAIIIMVNPKEYPDLENYKNRIKTYSSYEEFYRQYWKDGPFYEADRSDIDLHIKHRAEMGSVYWCVPAPGNGTPKWLKDIREGYFSQGQNNVTHKFTIVDIRQWKDFSIEERVTEEKYIAGSRREMWEDPCYYGDEKKGQSMIWIKIAKIEPLDKPIGFDNFVRALNKGKPLKSFRRYSIVSRIK